MMLNHTEIEKLGIITSGFNKDSLRVAGYDLRIKSMVEKGSGGKAESCTDDIDLSPQGVAVLTSQETIRLPNNVCAYASVKTSLCREGILAINSGVVDPGWDGPLSSLVLNFGKDAYRLKKDDVFLRLTFHKLADDTTFILPPKPIDADTYEAETTRKFDKRLASSFMDFNSMADAASKKMTADLRNVLLKYVPVAAFALVLITFLLNFATLKMANWTTPSDLVLTRAKQLTADSAKQTEKAEKDETESQKRILALENRLNELEKAKQIVTPTHH